MQYFRCLNSFSQKPQNKDMSKDSTKKVIKNTALALTAAYAVLDVIAKVKKPDSVYENEPEQKNPMEGKKTVFVESSDDSENADGKRGHLEGVGPSNARLRKKNVYEKYLKRALDKSLSFAGLVALSPVMLGISTAIKMEDPGPVLFTQKRVGEDKQYFKLHKFRSMKMSTPHDVPTHMLENPDSYITKVGGFIRKHSLDELPQIWDIFIGNMSIVGPRPALWNQDVLTAERDKYGANDIKPGLTGWAQINGRDELEIPDKAKLDGEYTRALKGTAKEAAAMDKKCFLGSVGVFAKDDSVVEGGTGELNHKYLIESSTIPSIKGKKILFFSPAFFGYENLIVKKMQELGAYVDFYDVRSVTSATDRALLKISPKIFTTKSKKYYERIIDKNRDKDYDYILIVKCDMTPVSILTKFKEVYPNAKLCLYLWDSVANIPGVEKKFKYFDTCYSFDPEDCAKYRSLKFRPLFYADQFKKEQRIDGFKYDISFLGTIHSDRYKVIRQVQDIAKQEGFACDWFLYLQSKFIYYFYKVTKKEFRDTQISDFDFEKKSSKEIAAEEDVSRTILDIQHPKQHGLTMRTIEMVGMNKKLITTNATIKNYDFYNKNNICVIDRNNVQIDKEFINKAYEPIDKDIYDRYSLENWIKTVLC